MIGEETILRQAPVLLAHPESGANLLESKLWELLVLEGLPLPHSLAGANLMIEATAHHVVTAVPAATHLLLLALAPVAAAKRTKIRERR